MIHRSVERAFYTIVRYVYMKCDSIRACVDEMSECEKCGDANCNINERAAEMEKCNETEIGQLEPNYSSERMCNAQCIGTHIE